MKDDTKKLIKMYDYEKFKFMIKTKTNICQ